MWNCSIRNNPNTRGGLYDPKLKQIATGGRSVIGGGIMVPASIGNGVLGQNMDFLDYAAATYVKGPQYEHVRSVNSKMKVFGGFLLHVLARLGRGLWI